MARAARKKVNIRTKTRIQARTLFVGTAVRKVICAQSVGRIQRVSLALVELKTKEAMEKPKNVAGKGAGSFEQGEQTAVVEPQAQPALASTLDLASTATLVRSPHLDHEGWLRWTYDTGARIGTETQVNSLPTVYKERLSAGGVIFQDKEGRRQSSR